MVDDIRDIADFYDQNYEQEHQRLEQHQLEFDLTWRFLEDHLPPRGHILEIGAATGRYTLPLAKQGYAITVVDISTIQIEFNRKRITAAGLGDSVNFVIGDARNLREIRKHDYDAVLLMGPLYHLVEQADRKNALREAHNRLRMGGLIFSSFISRYGIFGDLIKNIPWWITLKEEVRSLIAKGRDTDEHPRDTFRGYFAEVPEIAPLHKAVGFEMVKLVGVEPAISADDDSYNRLDPEQRKLWLDLLYEISANKTIIGASRHLLYIGCKPTTAME